MVFGALDGVKQPVSVIRDALQYIVDPVQTWREMKLHTDTVEDRVTFIIDPGASRTCASARSLQ